MKYLIVGGTGMLGRDLSRVLKGRDVTSLGRAQLDIGDPLAVKAAVNGYGVVINAAAFTQVNAAERDELAAYRINAVGAGLVAAAARRSGARLVHVSTDYVFSGSARDPYPENTALDPQNAYGRTKAEGETLVRDATDDDVLIVRTAWLYGAAGHNFAKTMAAKFAASQAVKVVNDQVGQPTWTADVAQQILLMLDEAAPSGIYHATNAGQASWFEFAQAIAAEMGADTRLVEPTDSAGFHREAPRPSYSVLGHDSWLRAGLAPMRDWRSALRAASTAGVLRP